MLDFIEENYTELKTAGDMIVFDFTGLMFAALHTDLQNSQDMNENFIRHLALVQIRTSLKKFKREYPQVVIAVDNTHSKPNWRKKYFKEYKAGRAKAKAASNIDWDTFYKIFQKIVDELKEHFPYKVVAVPGTEADDVIGVIAHSKPADTKMIIVSQDKDMKQLLNINGVKIFNPRTRKMVTCDNPQFLLKEHIIRGDAGDGVPHWDSPDDQFTSDIKKRQNSIFVDDLAKWVHQTPEQICNGDPELLRRYNRNRQMIDMSMIPEDIKTEIINEYNQSPKGKPNELYSYFLKKRLNNLLDSINDYI